MINRIADFDVASFGNIDIVFTDLNGVVVTDNIIVSRDRCTVSISTNGNRSHDRLPQGLDIPIGEIAFGNAIEYGIYVLAIAHLT